MRKVRNTLAAIAVLGVSMGIGACADLPTSTGEPDDPPPICYWFDGILHCDGE